MMVRVRARTNLRMILTLLRMGSFWLKLIGDIASLTAAWLISYWLAHSVIGWQISRITYKFWPITIAISAITYYLVFKYFRLYEPRRFLGGSGDPLSLFKATVLGFIITIFFLYNLKLYHISRKFLVIYFFMSLLFLHLSRFLINYLGKRLHRWGLGNRRLLIVGDNETSRGLYRRLKAHPEEGWIPLGIVPTEGNEAADDGIKRYRHPESLREYVLSGALDEIIICLPKGEPPEIFRYFRQLTGLPVTIRVLSEHFYVLWDKLPLYSEEFAGVPVIVFGGGRPSIWRLVVKRLLDIILSALVLIIGSPVWLIIAWMIRREDGGPALYTQERVKRLGRSFRLYKFRTMVVGAEEMKAGLAGKSFLEGPMFKVKDDPRITKIGRMLRKFSLDEIPQFINVLKGEMSLVGPRPPLPEEVAQYEDWHTYRIRGWVGLTGLWQICGRNRLQFEEAVLFDVFYLHNFSISLDFKIILLTASTVLSPKGSY
jgi:exopolysaccharide biosynthesis polyprenyl glycosylphosphotransferase